MSTLINVMELIFFIQVINMVIIEQMMDLTLNIMFNDLAYYTILKYSLKIINQDYILKINRISKLVRNLLI